MNKTERKIIISFLTIGLILSIGIVAYRNNWFSNEKTLTTEELENPDVDRIVINEKKIKIQPITDQDHILGNPNAALKIITYSDFECPYCAELFLNMDQILELYGMTGKIAWVYRHFPINQVEDSTSLQLSLASKCLADVGGGNNSSKIFWDFAKEVFTAETDITGTVNLGLILSRLEFSRTDYNKCMGDKKYEAAIAKDIEDGLSLAKEDSDFGTPYNIIYFPDGNHQIISGSISYDQLIEMVESIE